MRYGDTIACLTDEDWDTSHLQGTNGPIISLIPTKSLWALASIPAAKFLFLFKEHERHVTIYLQAKHFAFIGTFQHFFRILIYCISIYFVQLFILDQSCELVYIILRENSSELTAFTQLKQIFLFFSSVQLSYS